jgi:protease stability complex PrcB-like protein
MLAPAGAWRTVGMLACVLVSCATLTAGPASAMNQAASGPPAFRTVERGSQSNIDAPSKVVVRSTAEWAKLWKTHNFDKPEPRVDFDKEMVVGVFMGSRPTGGYTVEIVSLADKDGTLVVSYRETSPRPGTMAAQVLTFPYHLIATAKRSGEVKFEKQP